MADGKESPSQLNLPLLEQALKRADELTLELRELKRKAVASGRRKPPVTRTAVTIIARSSGDNKRTPRSGSRSGFGQQTLSAQPASTMQEVGQRADRPLRVLKNDSVIAASVSDKVEYNSRDAQILSAEEKIALFRKLFFGRQDVYALRWESQSTGKSGYQPAREHDYQSHVYDPAKKEERVQRQMPRSPCQ